MTVDNLTSRSSGLAYGQPLTLYVRLGKERKLRYLIILVFSLNFSVYGQELLQVANPAWENLTEHEKTEIQQQFVVESIPASTFGIIVDIQGIDRSTPGSNAGSSLGEAIGNATYIDKALNSGNYSAKNHLGALLLGGLIGATLDNKQQNLFQFRYAIKDGNGSLIYRDSYSTEPFRHPVGACVILPAVTLASNQKICTQTSELLRNEYLKIYSKTNENNKTPEIQSKQTAENEKYGKSSQDDTVSCKAKNLAPIRTTREKCEIIQGVIVYD